jgi:glutamate--cysteine ligase catalytic subunit
MGHLQDGDTLPWDDAKSFLEWVRIHGIQQFLNIYKNLKSRNKDELLWGDEVEYYLLEVIEETKTVKLKLRAGELLEKLDEKDEISKKDVAWRPEYGSFMIEATPSLPYSGRYQDLLKVEENMKIRKFHMRRYLEENEVVMTMTNFPLLGVGLFTSPPHEPGGDASTSIYTPDECINKHPRFATLTKNIRVRKGSKVAINVPLFMDKNTLPLNYEALFPGLSPNEVPALENHIYMDSMAFGMGQCCLQATFQCWNVSEARHLYDQLVGLAPIMLSLTAGSPIYRGYLADIDVRWTVISGSVDDRTPEELGKIPHENGKGYVISKSRYDSVSTYISEDPRLVPELNDLDLVTNDKIYQMLIDNGIDEILSKHLAHLFIRDPLVMYKGKIEEVDDKLHSDHFENIQSTNWQTVRFKPPPPGTNIGWRVEFRPMECQFTDFENAAFVVFIVLLTRVILSFDLNMYIPISKVDENMKTAHKRGSVLNNQFWFRKDISSNSETNDNAYVLMTINEIMNGSSRFRGMIPLIERYLEGLDMDIQSRNKIGDYLKLISNRASGKLITGASWIRKFVEHHPEYNFDSVVSENIAFDLIKSIMGMEKGTTPVEDLIGK